MEIEELKNCIPTLIALRDEFIQEGFEPTGNIEREHHLATMLSDWAAACTLHHAVEILKDTIKYMEDDQPDPGDHVDSDRPPGTSGSWGEA